MGVNNVIQQTSGGDAMGNNPTPSAGFGQTENRTASASGPSVTIDGANGSYTVGTQTLILYALVVADLLLLALVLKV